MNQPRHDNTFRKRATSKELSGPHMRALRKELLTVRADVERMELAQATYELRESVTHFSWLKFFVPGMAGLRFGKKTSGRNVSAGTIGVLLKQYPVVSSVASLLLSKSVLTGVARGAKPALKWGSLGLAAWEGFRIWQQIKRDNEAKAAASDLANADVVGAAPNETVTRP